MFISELHCKVRITHVAGNQNGFMLCRCTGHPIGKEKSGQKIAVHSIQKANYSYPFLGGLNTTQEIRRVIKNHKGTLFVKAILQEIPEHQFSYQSFLWSKDRVSMLPNSWKNHLSQLCGVYLLVSGDGKQYVGSTSSKEGGFLSRWKQYEKMVMVKIKN